MDNKQFFTICILSIILYYVGLGINKVKTKKKEQREYPINVYIDKVISSVNKMNGSEFEDFVEYIFKEMGFKAEQTPKTRDGGKDLILSTKDGKMYVEIKRYASSNLVTSPLVLKLIGSAVSDGVNKCLFLTTSGYTNDAIDTAEKSKVDIKLIDINGFVDMCKMCDADNVLRYLGY